MSYSLASTCWNCKLRENDSCSDQPMIQAIIQDIHSRTNAQGHKGAGTITILCHNHTIKEN
jgi:hypothetical protein